ncbi:peptidoglycan-binding protein [Nocardiopsis ganjiahuensis]|uniref:peptidoglycan-binding protein n=1 Tax=Nocardiopsis ganjiahuensis TaxID=239984 RepID=UPI0003448E32|nr:peptidoglycan-binding protein [Nocardiopsis ganjiahuensis]
MSQQLITGFSRRIASFATAGAIALGGVALMAPSASADDYERTPSEVIERIEAQSWPVYSVDQPGPSVDIEFAQHFMSQLGYLTPDPGREFTEDVEAKVVEFEEGVETISVNGVLESETWIKIRNMNFPGQFDSYQRGDRGHAVLGIKAILNEKFGAELDEENTLYDAATVEAVKAAQSELGLAPDGAFGRLSYKGIITYQEGESAAADVQAPVEKAPAEEAPAEEAPVEEAPAEEAPVEQAPAEDAEGSGEAADAERAEELEGTHGYQY